MPNSLPALVAGILQSNQVYRVKSAAVRFERTPLVPAYHVDSFLPLAQQPQRAAQAVSELVQKLVRLNDAYANWPVFEASPYFDFYSGHALDFYRLEETRHTMRLRLYCDLLLPAFRDAERFWVQEFLPLYRSNLNGRGMPHQDQPLDEAMDRLASLLAAAEQAIAATLDLLSDDVDVLVSLGGLEERIQHRPLPGTTIAPGLAPALQRLPREMPTLTLDVTRPRRERDA